MKKDNHGLGILLGCFIGFFALACIGIVLQKHFGSKYCPNSSFVYSFDVEVRTPEWDKIEQECRDRDNKEAYDRVRDGSTDPQDAEKSVDWTRDHLS